MGPTWYYVSSSNKVAPDHVENDALNWPHVHPNEPDLLRSWLL